MNRREFMAASLLATASMQTAGQQAHRSLAPAPFASPFRNEGSLPDLGGASHWLNSEPLSRRSLRGKVVLINFWTYSCINSLRPLPYLKRWAAQYKDDGLLVVGVHTPEFRFEKERANVEWAVQEFKVPYPVAMDNDYRIWRAFENEYWPAFYLVDRDGRIRHHRFGEGQYDESEREIRGLLEQNGAGNPGDIRVSVEAAGIEAAPGSDVRTPETYVGYGRGERFRSAQRIGRDTRKTYAVPPSLETNYWALSGAWEVGEESGLVRESGGKIALRFHSRDLHLVLAPTETGKSVPFRVRLEGMPPGVDAGVDVVSDGTGEVRKPRLYQLIRQKGRIRDRLFEIEFLEPGARAFSFTFG